jgi:hypothetical protein
MCHPKSAPGAEKMENPYKYDYENLKEVNHFQDLVAEGRMVLNRF